jgi:hypothetical protein
MQIFPSKKISYLGKICITQGSLLQPHQVSGCHIHFATEISSVYAVLHHVGMNVQGYGSGGCNFREWCETEL